MTAQHTPGPWEVDLCGDGAFAVYVPPTVDMGWSTVIASRNQLADRAAESHANAHLIAAAPELLEALKEAENALADYIPTIERTGASLNYGHKVLRDVRAAIQKATHKEQT